MSLNIDEIEAARLELNKYYHIIPVHGLERHMLPIGYTIKDLLAITAAWDAYVLDKLSQEIPTLLSKAEANEQEYQLYKERQDWEWQEVEKEARTVFAELIAALRSLPVARLTDPTWTEFVRVNTLNRYKKYHPMLKAYAQRQQHTRRH